MNLYLIWLINGYIDYKQLNDYATVFKPKLIICGSSAYPRDFDYKKIREIADMNNPFEYCDVVTSQLIKRYEVLGLD